MVAQPLTTDVDSLFRQYHRDLGAFAYGRLRDRDVASDVVQDAFVRYIAHTQGAKAAPEAPRFVLWRIVSNLILDLRRRERRWGKPYTLEDAGAHELVDPAPSPEREVIAREELRILAQALNALPPHIRTALVMNRVQQLTHAQIAAHLNVSPSMVNKYIMRALSHCAVRMMQAGL